MNYNNPKIALIGYGAMGREVENAAKSIGLEISDIFELDTRLSEEKNYDFDVAIDFSFPNEVVNNVRMLAKLKKNIVIGTTGWQDRKEEIELIVKQAGIACIYGSNFSIGMQMFSKIANYASKLMNKIDGYDIMLHEMHHKRKKDSPSGSAESLANIILSNVIAKNTIQRETIHGEIQRDMLHVSSTRGGEITGTHTIYIDSIADTLELTHRAKNRSGFAQGAVEAAKWIHDKEGFFEFQEMLELIWKNED